MKTASLILQQVNLPKEGKNMRTKSEVLKTTASGYKNTSSLMLEVKFDDAEHWSRLKDAEPYAHNKPVSLDKQVKALEDCRDRWVSTGGVKYTRAQYRIGSYKYYPERNGYAFEEPVLGEQAGHM
jgi:hypothetical protein